MAVRASARPPNCAETIEVSTILLWPPLPMHRLCMRSFSCLLASSGDEQTVQRYRGSNTLSGWHLDLLYQPRPCCCSLRFPSSMSSQLRRNHDHCAEAAHVNCRYAELLKEIRMGHVRKVMYFDNDESAVNVEEYQEVEGPCLVVFNDNQVAHSYVPRFDYRIP